MNTISKKSTISSYDVIIIGGGLAGLSSAIHLSMHDLSVALFEKNEYPRHKVCGEYISNEVLPYLKYLEIDPFSLGAKKIDRLELSTRKNKVIRSKLPLGGFGISRYTLDSFMAQKAVSNGVKLIRDAVIDVCFTNKDFVLTTKKNFRIMAPFCIGAYGKRDALDIKLDRYFVRQKSPFLAVKMHVKGTFPQDLVGLHNFEGGYCGVSKIENDNINLCYIASYNVFKKYRNIEEFQTQVLYKNVRLKKIFENSTPVFPEPLTISQISFSSKNPIEQHMLMCGDTAGLIHPLCGNGMSMAIRSAQILSEIMLKYFNSEISSRKELEDRYRKAWKDEFNLRLIAGRNISKLFDKDTLAEACMTALNMFPSVLPKIIRLTHGKPMVAS